MDWITFATQATEVVRRAIPFDKSCWHTVDPGTVPKALDILTPAGTTQAGVLDPTAPPVEIPAVRVP